MMINIVSLNSHDILVIQITDYSETFTNIDWIISIISNYFEIIKYNIG